MGSFDFLDLLLVLLLDHFLLVLCHGQLVLELLAAVAQAIELVVELLDVALLLVLDLEQRIHLVVAVLDQLLELLRPLLEGLVVLQLALLLLPLQPRDVVVEARFGLLQLGDLPFLAVDLLLRLLDLLLLLLQVHDLALHLFGLALLEGLQVALHHLPDALQPAQRKPVAPQCQSDQRVVLLQQVHVYLLVLLGDVVVGGPQLPQLSHRVDVLDQVHETLVGHLAAREVQSLEDLPGRRFAQAVNQLDHALVGQQVPTEVEGAQAGAVDDSHQGPDALLRDLVGGEVQHLQVFHAPVHEVEHVLDARQPPVPDCVPPQVHFLQQRVDSTLEEGLGPLCQQLVELEVDPSQVAVGLDVLAQGGPHRGLDEVLAEVEGHQVEPVEKDVLRALGLDEVLRDLEFPELLVLLEGDGDDLRAVDADVVVLELEHLEGLVLEEDGSEAAGAIDAERILADRTLLNAQIQTFEVSVLDEFLEDEGEADLADHVAGEVEALEAGAAEQVLDCVHAVLGDGVVGEVELGEAG